MVIAGAILLGDSLVYQVLGLRERDRQCPLTVPAPPDTTR